MERKVKYSFEKKLFYVEEVLKKQLSVHLYAKEKGISVSNLRRWIGVYQAKGKIGLVPKYKNTNYSVNFKLKVIQSIQKKSLSLREACLAFNIPTMSTLINWQRKYLDEGLAGLKLKSRGRPVAMNFKRKKRKSDKILTREEELLKENEYLRAENEILKKFNALVQQEQANQNKRLKP